MNYLRTALLDHLARSYALGTLHGAARRRFAKLVATSREARQSVAWSEPLNALAVSIPPLQPSQAVWQAVLERGRCAARRGLNGETAHTRAVAA